MGTDQVRVPHMGIPSMPVAIAVPSLERRGGSGSPVVGASPAGSQGVGMPLQQGTCPPRYPGNPVVVGVQKVDDVGCDVLLVQSSRDVVDLSGGDRAGEGQVTEAPDLRLHHRVVVPAILHGLWGVFGGHLACAMDYVWVGTPGPRARPGRARTRTCSIVICSPTHCTTWGGGCTHLPSVHSAWATRDVVSFLYHH